VSVNSVPPYQERGVGEYEQRGVGEYEERGVGEYSFAASVNYLLRLALSWGISGGHKPLSY
jgi:hypothetical protein